MNYKVKLQDILHPDEMRAVQKVTEVRIRTEIQNLTVSELIELAPIFSIKHPPETSIPKNFPAQHSLAVIINRCKGL